MASPIEQATEIKLQSALLQLEYATLIHCKPKNHTFTPNCLGRCEFVNGTVEQDNYITSYGVSEKRVMGDRFARKTYQATSTAAFPSVQMNHKK